MTSCAVNVLFKSFWNWRLKEFPEFATFSGVHDYDGKLQSYSMESIKDRLVTVEKYLKEASALILEPSLSQDNNLNLQYFIYELSTFCAGYKHKGFYFPLCYLDGVHIEFDRLLETMKHETESDYEKILERISHLPRQISEIIDLMKEGIANKMTFHNISISGVLKQLDMLIVPPEETIFYKPFLSIPDCASVLPNFKVDLQTRAKKVIDDVLSSFKYLRRFIEKDYIKHCRPEIAISSLPNGKEYYQCCLDYHLSCIMTPEEVHKTGLAEVERISKNMEKVIESLELKMSIKQFSEHIKKDSSFSFNNVGELLDAYSGAIFNLIEPKLKNLFSYNPKIKLEIESFPTALENSPAAYYYAGTSDGSTPGKFFINAADLRASPKYDVITLALHEGMPGHHLQASYLLECPTLPEFRRFLEDRRYTEAPTLFPLNTAYVEGWGLYSEYLGYELGFYDDPYFEYGCLSHEMLRACRLVVDTGLHVFGWSRDQAIEYMLSHTALHRAEIENEVNRYITWPGQACGYKIGELKIKALRKQAEEALGTRFDIFKFHDLILQSYGPLDIMEKRVLDFIKQHSG